MAKINPARFRDRLFLQDRSENVDSTGGKQVIWVNELEFWGKVMPRSANQRLYSKRLEHNISHIIHVRYNTAFLECSEKRILWVDKEDRVLQVQTAINVDENENFMELMCVEGVAT